jgi:hypothetical protein
VDFITVDRLEHSDENIVFDEKTITEDNHELCVCECVLCSIIDSLKNDYRKLNIGLEKRIKIYLILTGNMSSSEKDTKDPVLARI